MGVSCSRRLQPGWEKVQADMDDALSISSGTSPKGTRSRGHAYTKFSLEDDSSGGVAEERLNHALHTGDPRLIERACNEAETQGLERAKLSLARAEVRWLRAKAALEEAMQSGDTARIEQAKVEAEREGVDVGEVVKMRTSSQSPKKQKSAFSMQGLGAFFSSRATMSAAVAVLMYEWTAYNFVYLSKILPAMGKEAFMIPFAFVFNVVWGLAMWSFVRCHCSDPGSVPRRWLDFVDRMGDALPVAPARLEWQPGKATFCKRCDFPRPERAHHCHVCGMCVLRMDHHCPWINNCVGFGNHKFFLLLVGYCFLSCIVALGTASPELVYCAVLVQKWASGKLDWKGEPVRFCDIVVFVIFGLLAVLFAALLTPMIFTHFELASYNVTTIEGHYESANMPNPFDLGAPSANFEELLGECGLDWFLPVQPRRPLTDGVCFVRAHDRLSAEAMEEAGIDIAGDTAEEQLWRLRYQVRPGTMAARSRSQSTNFQWLFGTSRDAGDGKSPLAAGRPTSALGKKRVTYDSYGRRVVSI